MSFQQKILSYSNLDKSTLKKLFIFGVVKKIVFVLFLLYAGNANALSIYYDAQLDAYLKDISKTLIEKSNLKDVKLYIADSDQINAFATSNNEIVLYSGLIEKSDNKEQLQGVLAHEIAHLMAQHHIKSHIKNQNVSASTIAGALLGVGAIIAGAPQAGYAAIIGGNAASISKSLAHSREHENEADAIAIKLLDDANIPKAGLVEFFKILERQEQTFYRATPEYLSTHPSTGNRKAFITANIGNQKELGHDTDFNLFKTKIYALTNSPDKVIKRYSTEEESGCKSLALSVAYIEKNDFERAEDLINLSRKHCLDDIWYYDMLGQIMYQKGDVEEAIKDYKKSRVEGNDSWILDFQLAESYSVLKDKQALEHYYKAITKFKHFYYTYKRVADFYAKINDLGKAYSYLTTYYLKVGNKDEAKHYYQLLEKHVKKEKIKDPVVLQNLSDFKHYFEKK